MSGTIDSQLFSHDGWDEISIMDMQFYDVALKVAIGQFEVGHKFPVAILSGETSTLQLWEDDEGKIYHEFELKLSVGNLIPKE